MQGELFICQSREEKAVFLTVLVFCFPGSCGPIFTDSLYSTIIYEIYSHSLHPNPNFGALIEGVDGGSGYDGGTAAD